MKITVVIGTNGAGKTTLLDIAAGLYDREMPQLNKEQFPGQDQIIYSMQDPIWFSTLTVQQTLRMYQDIDHAGGQNANLVMLRIYKTVFEKIKNTKVGKLSGGERKLLLIYGSCLLKRKLYLFDEPLSGVDPNNKKLIMQLITSLVTEQRKQVIMTNHSLDRLTDLPIQVIAIDHGSCVFNDDYAGFLQQSSTQNPDEAFENIVVHHVLES